jgi:type VI secretion system secreted protein Hcp
MAIDVFLHLDGIKGESNDAAHQGWIECSWVDWAVYQKRTACTSSSGGHTAERCEFGSVALRKFSDLSSPLLLQCCAAGSTIPHARLEFFRADGRGGRVKYFEMELHSVLVGDVSPEAHQGVLLSEHVGLRFAKAQWRYIKQNIGGGPGGLTVGGWDASTNKIA